MIGELRILYKNTQNIINPYKLLLGNDIVTIRFVSNSNSILGLKTDIFSYEVNNEVIFSTEQPDGETNECTVLFDEYKEKLQKFLLDEYFKDYLTDYKVNMKTIRMLFKLNRLLEAKKLIEKMKSTPEMKILLFYIENKTVKDKKLLYNLILSLNNDISLAMYTLEYLEIFTFDEFNIFISKIEKKRIKLYLYLMKLKSIDHYMDVENYKFDKKQSNENDILLTKGEAIVENNVYLKQTKFCHKNRSDLIVQKQIFQYKILQLSNCTLLQQKMMIEILKSLDCEEMKKTLLTKFTKDYYVNTSIQYYTTNNYNKTEISINTVEFFEFDVVKNAAKNKSTGLIEILNPKEENISAIFLKYNQKTEILPVLRKNKAI